MRNAGLVSRPDPPGTGTGVGSSGSPVPRAVARAARGGRPCRSPHRAGRPRARRIRHDRRSARRAVSSAESPRVLRRAKSSSVRPSRDCSTRPARYPRPAASKPVACSFAPGLGEIQTSRQAGGMTSSSMRRSRSPTSGAPRLSTYRNARLLPSRRHPPRRATQSTIASTVTAPGFPPLRGGQTDAPFVGRRPEEEE